MTGPGRNWLNMQSHPTDAWAFWKTKRPELEEMRDAYDAIVECMTGNAVMSEKKAHELLDKLVSWARREAVCDEIFSSSEGA